MKGSFLALAFLGLGLVTSAPLLAQEDSEEKVQKLVASLHYQHGKIVLHDGLATLNIPDNFAYLDEKGAATVLTDIWGNPPDKDVLGLIVPKDFNPLKGQAWVVAISYDASGYVSDADASKIDYQAMLKDIQAGAAEENKERAEAGYPSVYLVGWAANPYYDQATHKLYWAKELEFGGDKEHTLNYNIRALGRRGVLVLNAIAGMDQLPEIEKAMPEVLAMVDFQEGHRYVDFDPKIDKAAGYGLAALVAGGVLAKTGFFKGLLIALLAGKKFIIGGAIALFAFVSRFFKRKE